MYACGRALYHSMYVFGWPTGVDGAEIPAPSPPMCSASGRPCRWQAA
jgi:hypothetical protein